MDVLLVRVIYITCKCIKETCDICPEFFYGRHLLNHIDLARIQARRGENAVGRVVRTFRLFPCNLARDMEP